MSIEQEARKDRKRTTTTTTRGRSRRRREGARARVPRREKGVSGEEDEEEEEEAAAAEGWKVAMDIGRGSVACYAIFLPTFPKEFIAVRLFSPYFRTHATTSARNVACTGKNPLDLVL